MEENNNSNNTLEPKKSFNPLFIVLPVIALLLIFGGIFISRKKQSAQQLADNSNGSSGQVEALQTQQTIDPSAPVKEFTVSGKNFSFEPATITVNKGDTVKINFKDDEGHHNLVVDGYGESTQTINAGGEDSITFMADKTGTFSYFCSVANHRDLGMLGSLIVQ